MEDKMKKTLSLLIALMMLISIITPIIASGDVSVMTLTLSDAEVGADEEEATFEVTLEGNPGFWGTQLFIVYDEGLSFAGFSAGDALPNGAFPFDPQKYPALCDVEVSSSFNRYKRLKSELEEDGIEYEGRLMTVVNIESPSLNDMTENGLLFSITLKISGLAEDEYPIDLVYSRSNTINSTTAKLKVNATGGTLMYGSVCPHEYGEGVVTPPGCLSGGFTVYTCSLCGKTKKTDSTSPLGHDYGSSVTDPTCTEKGATVYTCSRCGDTYSRDIPATGHDYSVSEVSERCGEIGTIKDVCSKCGDEKTETGTLIEHDYVGVITKSPTCTEAGTKTFTCSRCGDSYPETLDALGHSYSYVVTPPTQTEQGYKTYTCTVCGDTYDDDFVPPLGTGEEHPENTIDLTVEDATVDLGKGTTFDLYVRIDNNTDGFEYLKFYLFYPECLTLKSTKATGIITSRDLTAGIENKQLTEALREM